ncbi:penicillin-binding protein 2 [Evansella sp. LMS18]|uniref:penicillin-binding transpeptidase domain-containing protein n=1 Tax=Evansella sp. LMS18 TaxID=2924033 RepID=UPI0020D10A27|nr:penicillin-binding transpeptidase domain-containing protein [Evansella sp. LMS18]UTR09402.1 penicillin-binding protein 2 [Evansella sp. LMS18]
MNEKKVKKNHLPVRLNILFFLVFVLFSALILRLGVVQIVQGEDFEEQLERTINISSPVEAPRGLMYDRFGNLLVDNELLFTVTYTNRRTSQDEMIETAEKLNKYITVENDNPGDRDLREYWSILNPDEYLEKLSVEEAASEGLSDSEAHQERLALITDRELDSFTREEMEIFALWREFNAGYNNLPHKVKQGITYEEAAQIMENMEDLPGVDIIRDSERKYVYGDSLTGVFGSVGSIRRDDLDYFLANGYERNEEVGRSYLEAQYESVLRGRKGELENYMNQDGDFLRNPEERLGSRGNDLVLSIDMELQQMVEEILEDEMNDARSDILLDSPEAYVVMMEPETGDILAMAGYNEHMSPLPIINSAYEMGSTIKGATVLAGYDSGVMPPGTTIIDRTVQLPDTPDISSHRPLGRINDLQALEQSSNIYMIEVPMRKIGYIPGVSGRNWGNYFAGYDFLRDYFAQFGLGVQTGIDLPSETSGLNGGRAEPGRLLYLSFGQFDTYTPMQLSQYISTIANGGYRIAPRLVQEIREPGTSKDELGRLSQQMAPKVLNKIDVDESYISRVQEGFYRVNNGSNGTATRFFGDAPYSSAGKTGTAQVFVDGERANNQTYVGYAPYENPEVTITVVVPGVDRERSGVANGIARASLDAYFDLKEERNGPQEREVSEENDEE